MAAKFNAKYNGKCCYSDCPNGGTISKGQFITWNRVVKGQTAHFECFEKHGEVFPEPAPGTQPAPSSDNGAKPTPAPASAPDALTAMIIASVLPHLEAQFKPELPEEQLAGMIEDAVQKHVQRIEIVQPDKTVVKVEGAHTMFSALLQRVQTVVFGRRMNVWLYGAPGGGKTTAARQVAEALGLRFATISLTKQTSETRLIGFQRPNGEWTTTEFIDFYENGGVYLIDEAANASGNLTTMLNMAFENGHLNAQGRQIKRHADFIVIAADNTNGKGANVNHSERGRQDAAYLARFTFMHWHYDTNLEQRLAESHNPKHGKNIFKWVGKVREYCAKNGLKDLVVSPRETAALCALLNAGETLENALDGALWHGLEQTTIDKVLAAVPFPALV